MYTPPEVIVSLLKPFENLFDPRTWRKAQLLAVGAILSPGKRTVSAALSALGMRDDADFSLYHHVLNRARWKPLSVSRVLLTMLIEWLHRDGGTLVFGMDETIERRNGKRISALGWYRDPTRSSHSHTVKTTGLRWVSMMWLSRVPFAGRHWALPFLTALAPSSALCRRTGAPPKTLIDVARQMMMCLRRWLPEHDLVVVADGGYSVKALLRSAQLLSEPIIFVTRLRMDASLHAPAPQRRRGQRGRPRVVGDKLPGLAKALCDPSTVWETIEVGWYGSTTRTLQVASGVAVWYNRSKPTPAVHIRWVLVRDPLGELSPQTLACTDTDADPRLIVEWFALRWSATAEGDVPGTQNTLGSRDSAAVVRLCDSSHDPCTVRTVQCGDSDGAYRGCAVAFVRMVRQVRPHVRRRDRYDTPTSVVERDHFSHILVQTRHGENPKGLLP